MTELSVAASKWTASTSGACGVEIQTDLPGQGRVCIYISPLRLEFMLSGIDYIYSVGCLIIFGAAAAIAAA